MEQQPQKKWRNFFYSNSCFDIVKIISYRGMAFILFWPVFQVHIQHYILSEDKYIKYCLRNHSGLVLWSKYDR